MLDYTSYWFSFDERESLFSFIFYANLFTSYLLFIRSVQKESRVQNSNSAQDRFERKSASE